MTISKQQLKQKIEEMKDYVDKETCIFVRRFADIENRLTKLESTKEFDPEVTVIAINLEQSGGEIIMDKAHELVRNGMCSDVNIVRAKRLTPHGRAPGLVKIELPTLHDKIELLRKKVDLVDSRVYSKVFVRSSKSHTERLVEINTQMILKETGLHTCMYITANGRLRYRGEDYRPRQQQGVAPAFGHGGPTFAHGGPGSDYA